MPRLERSRRGGREEQDQGTNTGIRDHGDEQVSRLKMVTRGRGEQHFPLRRRPTPTESNDGNRGGTQVKLLGSENHADLGCLSG